MALSLSPRSRVLAGYLAAGFIATAVVTGATAVASFRAGNQEAINAARDQTQALATALISGQPDPTLAGTLAETARMNDLVRHKILVDTDVVRVKIWDATGRIVYSDENRLISQVFPLGDDELAVLDGGPDPETGEDAVAGFADPNKDENVFERDFGPMLQIYVPVLGKNGEKLLFEIYYLDRTTQDTAFRIFWEFVPILVGGLLLLAAVNLPLAWRLAKRSERDQEEKAELLQAAVDASEMERHRIAGDLHDGVVQDLTGITFSLAAVADRLSEEGSDLAPTVKDAAAHTRSAVSALRSLLIEIYPPNLRDAGLPNALDGLLASVRSRDIVAELDVSSDVLCSVQTEALVFRSAQEALRNVVTHADAHHVVVALRPQGANVVLTVTDDGVGIDGDSWRTPKPGHAGLRFLTDLVTRSGGRLDLSPGVPGGTVFSVTVPSEVVV
jgi:two-component system, NarL family, sensor kinase